MYHNAQQTVRLLPLPFEVSDIINSFLFYSIETIAKKNKQEIIQKINCAYYSRKNNILQGIDQDEDEDEHWTFMVFCPYDLELQFQAINCSKCGNYKLSETDEISNKAICLCKSCC